jgi:hypothetical protein
VSAQKKSSGSAAKGSVVPGTLHAWWEQAKRRGQVYVVTDRVARSNMSAAYSLYVVNDRGELDRAWPIASSDGEGYGYSLKLAKALGHNLKSGSWVRKGCSYDRAHDILYSMARQFGDTLESANGVRISRLGGQ